MNDMDRETMLRKIGSLKALASTLSGNALEIGGHKVMESKWVKKILLYTNGELSWPIGGRAYTYEVKTKSLGAGTYKVWLEHVNSNPLENIQPDKTIVNLKYELAQITDFRNRAEEQLACCCDLLNTWAREIGVQECHDPYNNLNLRNLVDCLWNKVSAKIHDLQGVLDRRNGTISTCLICGKKVPFNGAVFCSEKCSFSYSTKDK